MEENYNYLFDNVDLNSTQRIKGRSLATLNKHKEKLLKRYDELKDNMTHVNDNECLHIISSDNFGSIELLKYYIEHYDIDELIITTWSFNQTFVDLIKSLNCKIIFYVDKSIKKRKSSLYNQMAQLGIDKKIVLKTHYKLHSKVTLISTNCNNKYVIESSANYSENHRIENYTVTNDKQLFNFHKNWMDEIMKG